MHIRRKRAITGHYIDPRLVANQSGSIPQDVKIRIAFQSVAARNPNLKKTGEISDSYAEELKRNSEKAWDAVRGILSRERIKYNAKLSEVKNWNGRPLTHNDIRDVRHGLPIAVLEIDNPLDRARFIECVRTTKALAARRNGYFCLTPAPEG
jgi:hypothetical protein